ncbi:MAG: calcium/proton exchanger [Deltaproteobacteria bacterium]|nr:calcium/proton exchanger [Deltaproteobacteria bacterium]
MKIMYGSLAFIPFAILARLLGWGDVCIFVFSGIAIIPLAAILSDATEQVSIYTGPKIGGMLNATMGNVPELLIGFFAMLKGPDYYPFVMASMIGSVIGNVMLVMGCAAFVGGLTKKIATCNKNIPRFNFTLLIFGLFAFAIPTVLQQSGAAEPRLAHIALGVSVCLIVVYLANLYFSLNTHKGIFDSNVCILDASFGEIASGSVQRLEDEEAEEATWSLGKALLILAAATVAVAVMSEFLVGSVKSFAEEAKLPMAFIGIVLVPILGNVAEHGAAIIMAWHGKMNISVEIAVGSGTQIALFVSPLLVVISFLLTAMGINGEAMELIFTPFELLSMAGGIGLGAYMLIDGRTHWMEGMMLIVSYILVGLGFFFL